MIKIVGISGSPVKDSNTHLYLERAISPSVDQGQVQARLFDAGKMNIGDCIQCNHCLFKQTRDRLCSIRDDMADIYEAVIAADVLVLATPVYFGRLSGYLAKVIDRLRAVHYGKAVPSGMKNKIGAGLALAWYRHGGLETTLMTLHLAFYTMEMIVAAPSVYGGAGVTSLGGDGSFDPKDRHQILKDDFGLNMAEKTVLRAIELANLVRSAQNSDQGKL